MKKIGIVGGMAWLSTVDYYAQLCRLASALGVSHGEGASETPEFTIESLNLTKALALIGEDGNEQSWREFDAYHRAALLRLRTSGADFAVIASNAPHHRFESIRRDVDLPVISIVDAVASKCVEEKVDSMLVLGTALTMRSPMYPAGLARQGCDAWSPRSEELRRRTVGLIEHLQAGAGPTARSELEQIVDTAMGSMPSSPRTAVCLACTELPLAFPENAGEPVFYWRDRLYISSTAVHIRAAFAAAVAPL